jgi:hypothetical protein
MRNFFIAILFVLFATIPSSAKGIDSIGVFKTDDFHYSLKAPAGWILDTKSGAKDGLPVIFYPRGNTWENSPVVLYTFVQPLDTAKPMYLVVNEDSRRMSMSVPSMKAKHLQVKTIDGQKVQVVHFISEDGKVFDAVAYIEAAKKSVVRVVYSAKSMEDFTKNLPALEESLQSYNFTAGRK